MNPKFASVTYIEKVWSDFVGFKSLTTENALTLPSYPHTISMQCMNCHAMIPKN